MRTTVARLVAVALLLTACSVAAEEPVDSSTSSAPTSTTSTSTSTSTSTTSTTIAAETSLLNGLPVEDDALLDRRVMAVKIDNHPRATPQSGIDKADMVMEIMVEGITRFLTFWHESDADYLGPNRSARPTDSEVLAALNEPTFVFSGGQAWVQNLIARRNINTIKEGSEGTFRISGRRAPHNLYVDTYVLRETADERGYADNPPEGPLWNFGDLQPTGTATHVDIAFTGQGVSWDWDAAQGLWLRTAYGSDSMYVNEDGTEGHIGVPVLIALYVEQYTARPAAGESGKALPSSHTVGEGKAYVFADGQVAEGTWSRETETEWFTLLTEDGQTMNVPPGKSWITLVPDNRGLTFE